jgi:hypothetical protein
VLGVSITFFIVIMTLFVTLTLTKL